VRLSELGEFGLIARIARLAERVSGVAVRRGIGHDAALLRTRPDEDVAVTADTLVEGVHFRLERESPRNVGRRALVANLSDLAATGARPLGFTLALAAPPGLTVKVALDLVRGMLDVARQHGCPLVGGNVARAPEVSLAITALGGVGRGRALGRDGARAGDRLLVTGTLGAAALARARSDREGTPLRFVAEPRLAAGRALAATSGVRACIDVSDGLLADLRHLARASGVGVALEADRVPRPRGFDAACRRLGLEPDRLALAGGEDFELLFAAGRRAPSAAELARRLKAPVSEIGRFTPRGIRVRRARGGTAAEGWRHF
jgi:thiamine-monophosphate kinase